MSRPVSRSMPCIGKVSPCPLNAEEKAGGKILFIDHLDIPMVYINKDNKPSTHSGSSTEIISNNSSSIATTSSSSSSDDDDGNNDNANIDDKDWANSKIRSDLGVIHENAANGDHCIPIDDDDL